MIQQVVCPVFIGRFEELAALHDARRALARSRGSIVLVGGEAGLGKSRLLAQFVKDVARQPRAARIVGAECLEFAEQPFGPWREIFAGLGEDFPDAENARVEKREIFARVLETLRAVARARSTIVSIEDLHWADRSTLELLTYLAPRLGTARLMLVATYRTDDAESREPLAAALARLAREGAVARIDLAPLSDAETRDLIDGSLGARWTPPPGLRETVVRRSEGNPFFAEELLKDASEARTERDDTIPFSIRASVAERIESLGEADRRILSHAAVLGYRFDPQLLALVADVPVDTILSSLRRALDRNVLVEENAAGTRGGFRFRHALVRDAVAATMLRFEARRTHERVLAILERETDPRLDALAHHAWAAGDRARTARYARAASLAALALRAIPEARDLQRRAAESLPSVSLEAAGAWYDLANLEEMLGELHAAAEHFATARDLFRSHAAHDRVADAERGLSLASANLGDLAVVDRGIAFLESDGDRLSAATRDVFLATLARIAAAWHRRDDARACLERIVAPEALPPRSLQHFEIAAMYLAWYGGETGAWQISAKRSLASLDRLPAHSATTLLLFVALTATTLGEERYATDALDRADRIARLWELETPALYAASVRALHAHSYGRIAEAREALLRAERVTEIVAVSTVAAMVAPLLALELGEPALVGAATLARFAESRACATPSCDDAPLFAASASWELARGGVERARADLRSALACVNRLTPNATLAFALAAIHLEPDDLAPVRAAAVAPYAADDRAGRAGAALVRAVLERRFGDTVRAKSLATHAEAAFADLGWTHLRALAAAESRGGGAPAATIAGDAPAPSRPSRSAPDAAAKLTGRENDVAREVARGSSNAEIAERLSITIHTVEKHITSIFEKFGVRNRTQIAVRLAHSEEARR